MFTDSILQHTVPNHVVCMYCSNYFELTFRFRHFRLLAFG